MALYIHRSITDDLPPPALTSGCMSSGRVPTGGFSIHQLSMCVENTTNMRQASHAGAADATRWHSGCWAGDEGDLYGTALSACDAPDPAPGY